MRASDCLACKLPSNILVRGVNWVGDTVMTLPAMKALRDMFPGANMVYWAPESLADLLRVTRIPDDIIAIPSRLGKLSRPFIMQSVLRKRKFDLVVLLQNAFESAFTAWMAGIPIRVGYPTDGRGLFITLKVPLTREIRQQHQVYYYLQIVKCLGDYFGVTNKITDQKPDCSIPSKRAFRQDIRTFLRSRVNLNNDRIIICLCPGSVNSEAKRWPTDYFSALADLLIREMDAFVIFMGAPAESGLIDGILGQMGREDALNLAGKTSMEESMGVMSLCDLVISNDTGSAHLAVAASAKTLTIFGPTIPGATAPFGPNTEIMTGQSGCSPCRHFSCPLPGHPCMRSITPNDVLEKASAMIEAGNK